MRDNGAMRVLIYRATSGERKITGIVELRDTVAVTDEDTRAFLEGHFVPEPGNPTRALTFGDGVEYLFALPYALSGTYCWAELEGHSLSEESYKSLGEQVRNDQADAALVAATAQAMREWQATTGLRPSIKPLREMIWFYWQAPRLPKPRVRGKYPKSFPWSAAARAAYRGDPRCPLVIEHAQPIALLVQELLDGPPLVVEAVRRLLEARLQCVVLTPEEDDQIDAAGVGQGMPEGWQSGDLWARYRAAGLDLEGFAPLEED